MPKIISGEITEIAALQMARIVYGLGLENRFSKEVRTWITARRIADKSRGIPWPRISFVRAPKRVKALKPRAKKKKRVAPARPRKVFITAEPKQATEGLQKALLARAKALRPSSL